MLQNYRHADSGAHWLVQAPQFHYYARFSRYESFNLQPLKRSMTNVSSSIFFVKCVILRLSASGKFTSPLTYNSMLQTDLKSPSLTFIKISHLTHSFNFRLHYFFLWWGLISSTGDAPATTLQNYRHADSGVHWLVQAPQFHYYARSSRYESFNPQSLNEVWRTLVRLFFLLNVLFCDFLRQANSPHPSHTTVCFRLIWNHLPWHSSKYPI